MFEITSIKHDGQKYRFRFKCPITGKSHGRRGLDENALEKHARLLLPTCNPALTKTMSMLNLNEKPGLQRR